MNWGNVQTGLLRHEMIFQRRVSGTLAERFGKRIYLFGALALYILQPLYELLSPRAVQSFQSVQIPCTKRLNVVKTRAIWSHLVPKILKLSICNVS